MIVSNASELGEALRTGAREIEIRGTITGSPMITLAPGVTLRGGELRFGAKGVRLTSDNTLDGVTVIVPDDEVAILNDTSVGDLGTLTLRGVRTRGQVLLVAANAIKRGHLRIEGLQIAAADVRGRSVRPRGYGVEALQGALTVWNRQADAGVKITAEILDVSVGTSAEPIRGSGVFVGGHGDDNGKGDGGILAVSHLLTGEVHTNGAIPEATPDLISGGVFVISGAVVDRVTNLGAVTTRGPNDMVLDNWGSVRTWTARGQITSHGPSGIGFVNFGAIGTLDVQAVIETHGKGARGFNLYDGTLGEARFTSIHTTGDGSVGIQISKPMGVLTVTGDVTTTGGEGLSLVKGVQTPLKAIALSIKPGAEVIAIKVGGRLATSGAGVVTAEIEGAVGRLDVAAGITATGAGSDAVHVKRDVAGLDAIEVSSVRGRAIVR